MAMSGGVDSSVAAMMLHEEGYEVIGVTMKTWDYASSGGAAKETGCCSLDSINDARNLAVKKGFPHIILDLRKEFGDYIINDFVEEYLAGRTPNPCVLCNTHIKWEALLKRADQLDCEFIATGHYARLRHEEGRYILSKGVDEDKDQSYVLWGVSQENFARTKYPLGAYTKTAIRQMAADYGFPELADKSESYEICFIPDNDYRGFLKRNKKGLDEQVGRGLFVDKDGNILGEHNGYPFYTIGQRKGLGIALGDPMYVTEIQPEHNKIVLGREDELQQQEMWVSDINYIKYEKLEVEKDALTKIRHHHKGAKSIIMPEKDGRVKVEFKEKVSAVAPGQSAVFYEGDDVIGGGFIASPASNQKERKELLSEKELK